MSGSNGHKRWVVIKRENLYREQNGLCYWCKKPMMLAPGHVQHKTHALNEATLDHLFSRLSPDRGKVNGRSHVLACWQCNRERGSKEVAGLPIGELRYRSGNYPWPIKWIAWLAVTGNLESVLSY